MLRKGDRLSEQLKTAIQASVKTCYRISQETGIAEASLSRFMNGKGGLSMRALDKIGECLGLEITTRQMPRKRKGR